MLWRGSGLRSKLAQNSHKMLGAAAIVGARRLGRNVREVQAQRLTQIEQLPAHALVARPADLPAADDMRARRADADAMHFDDAGESFIDQLQALALVNGVAGDQAIGRRALILRGIRSAMMGVTCHRRYPDT